LSQSLTTAFQHVLVAFSVVAGAADAADAPKARTDSTTAPARIVWRVAFLVIVVVSRAPIADKPNVRHGALRPVSPTAVFSRFG
jgi:hypothetical protein